MLGLNDPEKRQRLGQGLIALGGSMMKAGGPSYTPNNFLGALGDGVNSFAKSYSGSADDALKRAYTRAQIGNLQANTSLHGVQAAQLQAQAAARAQFNGVPNPLGTGNGVISTTPGAPAPGQPAPGTPAVPGQAPAPTGQPLPILPPGVQPGNAQAAPTGAKPPVAAPGAPAAPSAPAGAPAQAQAPAAPMDTGTVLMARIKQLNEQARQARAAGYDTQAQAYSDQAMALEKHAFNNGQVLMPDGTLTAVPGYAAGKGQVAQAEAAGKSAGEMPGKMTMADYESNLRLKEQAAKDASGDKKTFDDRAKDMNNSWNQSDYNKKFLQASNIRAGFDRAFKDQSGLGTAQLVLDWYKLNDPGSVVSQNEIQSLSTKTQSMPEGMISAINQALTGGGMSDDNKIKILKNMDGKYQDQRQTYEKQRDNQRALAGKIGGIDPTMVIPDVSELHGAWKSPQELAAEKAAQEAAARAPALGGGAAPGTPPALGGGAPGLPTFAPNDPKLRSLKKGDQFKGTDGVTYTVN